MTRLESADPNFDPRVARRHRNRRRIEEAQLQTAAHDAEEKKRLLLETLDRFAQQRTDAEAERIAARNARLEDERLHQDPFVAAARRIYPGGAGDVNAVRVVTVKKSE